MKDLIEALQIFLKYTVGTYAERRPTHCEHDVMQVCISPALVSAEDKARLDELSFTANSEDDCFHSFRFGSA